MDVVELMLSVTGKKYPLRYSRWYQKDCSILSTLIKYLQYTRQVPSSMVDAGIFSLFTSESIDVIIQNARGFMIYHFSDYARSSVRL